jgi:outer membrane protein TolC
MKISHPFFLASLSAAITLSLAPSSYAGEAADIEVESSNSIAVTVLPSKARATVPLAVIAAANPVVAPATPVKPLVKTPIVAPVTPIVTPIAPLAPVVVPTVPTKPATPLPPSNSPTPVTPTKPVAPVTPVTPVTPATPPPTSATPPATSNKAVLPEYLNPDPNPLLFPTKVEEVTLKGIQPISLKEAIALAERNNRTLEQSRIQLEQSRSRLTEANADRYPSVFVEGDLNRSKSSGTELNRRAQLNRLEGTIGRAAALEQLKDADDPQTTLSFSANVQYSLFTSGRRNATIKTAEKQIRLSELEVERVLAQTRFDVSNDYYDLQDADEQIITTTAAVTSATSNLKDANAQFEAGLGTKFDVLRAQVQLANNQQQLNGAVASRDVRRRQLAQRLSLRESVGVRASDPVKEAGTWQWTREETIVRAYKNRAELEQQLVQRDISEQQKKLALSALGPTVTLGYRGDLTDVFEDSLGVAFGSGYTISAQARWSLFDGGRARAQAAREDKNKELAESRFAEARNSIRFEVERAYTTLVSNQSSIKTTEIAVSQAEEALRLAILRFQAGVGTQTDRINAEADLTRSRGNRTSAIIGYNRALAQLTRAVSNLTEDIAKVSVSPSK